VTTKNPLRPCTPRVDVDGHRVARRVDLRASAGRQMTAAAAGGWSRRGLDASNGSSGSHNPWKLRRFAASISDDRALKSCGRKFPRGHVGDADEVVTITRHCQRAWLCPVCGYYAAAAQQLYAEIVAGAACVCGQCTADSFGVKAIHKLIDVYPDPIAVTELEDYQDEDR
jgi:hypothetical protein